MVEKVQEWETCKHHIVSRDADSEVYGCRHEEIINLPGYEKADLADLARDLMGIEKIAIFYPTKSFDGKNVHFSDIGSIVKRALVGCGHCKFYEGNK